MQFLFELFILSPLKCIGSIVFTLLGYPLHGPRDSFDNQWDTFWYDHHKAKEKRRRRRERARALLEETNSIDLLVQKVNAKGIEVLTFEERRRFDTLTAKEEVMTNPSGIWVRRLRAEELFGT